MILALGLPIALILILLQWNMPKEGTKYEYPLHVGYGIVVEKIEAYDGIDFENRSTDVLTEVAAAVIENKGAMYIENAQINILLNDKLYKFDICILPPGMRILVIEANKMRFVDTAIVDYSFTVSFMDSPEDSRVLLRDNEVINIGNQPISVIYYSRLWDEKSKLYCGGIAHKYKIEYLPVRNKVRLDETEFYNYRNKLIYIEETPVLFGPG